MYIQLVFYLNGGSVSPLATLSWKRPQQSTPHLLTKFQFFSSSKLTRITGILVGADWGRAFPIHLVLNVFGLLGP